MSVSYESACVDGSYSAGHPVTVDLTGESSAYTNYSLEIVKLPSRMGRGLKALTVKNEFVTVSCGVAIKLATISIRREQPSQLI